MELIKGEEFVILEELLISQKLFRPRYGAYALHAILISVLWVVCASVLVSGARFWTQMANAALLAFVFGQAGLFLHALAHGQVIGSRWRRVVYPLSDVLWGLGMDWWIDKHERHHAAPNYLGEDPDIGIVFVAFHLSQTREKSGMCRFTTKHQHILMPFLLLFEGWHLLYASVKYSYRHRAYSVLCLLGIHNLAYLGSPFFFLPPWHALGFVLAYKSLLGLYLGMAFVVNHTGRPIEESAWVGREYLRAQVETARNVRGGWWATLLFGGLNFQIEHHLFPGMPHYNLRRAMETVRPFCEIWRIHYHSVGLCAAYREVFTHLRETARSA